MKRTFFAGLLLAFATCIAAPAVAADLQPSHTSFWQAPTFDGGFGVIVTPTTVFVAVYDRGRATWRYSQGAPVAGSYAGDLVDPQSRAILGAMTLDAISCDALRLVLYSPEVFGTFDLVPTAPLPGRGACNPGGRFVLYRL